MNQRYQKPKYSIPDPLPFQTPGEEIANSILHGLGGFLSIAGLCILILRAQGYWGGRSGGPPVIAAYTIFTAAMISMFLASTLYHAIQYEGAKRVFRILDHAAIYLIIAGTYTPFCVIMLQGLGALVHLCLTGALAAAGICLYTVNLRSLRKLELGVYTVMALVIALGVIPRFRIIPQVSLIMLFSGGAAYLLGGFWYFHQNRRGAHVIWHCFTLSGAICHWWAIWFLS